MDRVVFLIFHSSCTIGLIGLKSKANSMLTSAAMQNGQSTSGISICILEVPKRFSFFIFTLEKGWNKIVHQPKMVVFSYFQVHWNKYVVKVHHYQHFLFMLSRKETRIKCRNVFVYSINWNNGLIIVLLINSVRESKSVYCILLL